MTDIEELREEVRSQVGTIARQDRAIADYKQRIALLERTVLQLEASSADALARVTELETAGNGRESLKERLVAHLRNITSRIEQL